MKTSAERSADSNSTAPVAWAILDEGSDELLDVSMIEPEDLEPGLKKVPLYYASK